MSASSWPDRLVDMLRSPQLLFLLIGLALGWLCFAPTIPEQRLYLQLVNQDSLVIDSISLDFGFDLNQSKLISVQLRPGESRNLVLNHPPGRGFNVEVRYSDGQQQIFCANKNLTAHHQQLFLKR